MIYTLIVVNLNISHNEVAPAIISHNSVVILACLDLLYISLRFPRISFAFFEAFSIAFILADYSEAALFKNATHKFDVKYNSYNAGLLVFLSGRV